MNIQEIIDMLADVRTNLKLFRKSIDIEYVKGFLKDQMIDIDIIGCELTQNIAKKLKEK